VEKIRTCLHGCHSVLLLEVPVHLTQPIRIRCHYGGTRGLPEPTIACPCMISRAGRTEYPVSVVGTRAILTLADAAAGWIGGGPGRLPKASARRPDEPVRGHSSIQPPTSPSLRISWFPAKLGEFFLRPNEFDSAVIEDDAAALGVVVVEREQLRPAVLVPAILGLEQ
jgi:hypothetical protein